MQSTKHKIFRAPEERRDFPHGHADILRFTGGVVGEEAVAVIDWFGASQYATHYVTPRSRAIAQ